MFATRNVWIKHHSPENGGEGGGGGGDNEAAKKAAEEAAKKAAEEAAKKTSPTDAEAALLKENMQKKEALRKAQEELAAFKKQFEGIDPEAVRKILSEQKDAETKALEAKGDYERLKQRMAEEHGKEVTSLKEQIAALQGEIGKAVGTINELSIGGHFGQSSFIANELTMPASKARALYADHFDLVEGKVVGYDKPRGASGRTALVDQYGNAVSFDDAMRKIVDADPEKDYLLRSKTKGGASSDSRKSSGQANKEVPEGGIDRIAAGLKNFKFDTPGIL